MTSTLSNALSVCVCLHSHWKHDLNRGCGRCHCDTFRLLPRERKPALRADRPPANPMSQRPLFRRWTSASEPLDEIEPIDWDEPTRRRLAAPAQQVPITPTPARAPTSSRRASGLAASATAAASGVRRGARKRPHAKKAQLETDVLLLHIRRSRLEELSGEDGAHDGHTARSGNPRLNRETT